MTPGALTRSGRRATRCQPTSTTEPTIPRAQTVSAVPTDEPRARTNAPMAPNARLAASANASVSPGRSTGGPPSALTLRAARGPAAPCRRGRGCYGRASLPVLLLEELLRLGRGLAEVRHV